MAEYFIKEGENVCNVLILGFTTTLLLLLILLLVVLYYYY